MGLLGTLGKWAIPAASLAAIPFTGGASALGAKAGLLGSLGKVAGAASKFAPALGAIGQVASGAAKGNADSRADDARLLMLQQQLAQQGARDKSNDSLDRARFGLDQQQFRTALPSIYAQQAARGGLMANVQDAKVARPEGSTIPNFSVSGGLRPSALGPDARAAGADMAKRALAMQLQGGPEAIDAGPGYQAPPDMKLPQAGAGSNILSGIGLGSSILGALGGLVPQQQAGNVPTQGRLAGSLAGFLPKSPNLLDPLENRDLNALTIAPAVMPRRVA